MDQDEINENKSFVAFYFAKFNEEAREALGYRTFSEAFSDCSVRLGGPDNNYLKQRRDEFDVFFQWRRGYANRPVTDAVRNYYNLWNGISQEEFTARVRTLLGL